VWGLLGRLFGKKKGPGGAGNGGINIRSFKPEILIAGLGNPGSKYEGTRHNVGFEVADRFCALGAEFTGPEEYCEAMCRAGTRPGGGKPVLAAKPLTYMNLSGDSVGALVKRYGLSADRCLIIVDDFQLPLGKLRFRKDGSPGGHNGLKSVSAAIGGGYPRLRVGIGPLPPNAGVIDFVLGRFDESEREEVGRAIDKAAEAVSFLVDNGIDAAMNLYN
jgi:PTH1 family peptidyl-tRNA hydrolase